MGNRALPRKGLKDKWSELSFESKMAIFVGPLFVALVSGAVLALPGILRDGDGDGDQAGRPEQAPPTSFAAEKLEVLDFFVDGGQRQELLADPPTTYPKIDVTVRNVGQSVSVLTRAEFEILDFGHLEICEAGGGLGPSMKYDVGLPPEPVAGDVVVLKISQALRPNTADRFTFEMNVLPEGQANGVFMYRVAVRLIHDGDEEAVTAGTALLAVPFLPYDNYFPQGASLGGPSDLASFAPNDGSVEGCYLANEETYLKMIELEGSRDLRMDADLVPEWP